MPSKDQQSRNMNTSSETSSTFGSPPYPPIGFQLNQPPPYPPNGAPQNQVWTTSSQAGNNQFNPGQQPLGQTAFYDPNNPSYYPGNPTVIVVTQQAPTIVSPAHRSFAGHIALACFVAWCCGCLFGTIAFILAMFATSKEQTGNKASATRLARASLGLSIAGIVITVIVVGLAVGLSVASPYAYRYVYSSSNRYYCYNGYSYYYQNSPCY